MAERMISVPDTDDEFLLYNNRTGKFEEHTGILDRTYDESKWEKVILKHLVSVLDLTGGTKTKVVGYFLKKKDFNNHIIATQQEIADSVGVSRPVVNQVVKVMIKNEFMKINIC